MGSVVVVIAGTVANYPVGSNVVSAARGAFVVEPFPIMFAREWVCFWVMVTGESSLASTVGGVCITTARVLLFCDAAITVASCPLEMLLARAKTRLRCSGSTGTGIML